MALSDLLSGVAGSANAVVEIHSNIAPPFVVNLSETPNAGQGGIGTLILGLVKPSIRIQSDFGSKVIEPYGAPDDGAYVVVFGIAALAALGFSALATYGAYKLIKS